MQKLHSHTVSRCPLWSLVLALFKAKKKTTEKQYKNQKINQNKNQRVLKEEPAPRRLPIFFIFVFGFFWFLAYRKPSTLLIWIYSAPSSKTYMLNSESISETFHLQAALRDTVVTGSSRKKAGPWKAAAEIKKCVYAYMKSGSCRPLFC